MEYEKALALLQGISFFNKLNLEEKKFLATLGCDRFTFPKARTIITQGQIDSSLYILLAGELKVIREPHPTVTLAVLKPGDVFGEVSFIEKRPRTTSVIALEESTVLKMDGQTIQRLNPVLLNKIKDQLIDLLIRRLDSMNQRMAEDNS